MLKCSEVFERNTFKSYSEFYLMLAMARECQRRGTCLDVSDMIVGKDVIPEKHLKYYRLLVKEGAIFIGENISDGEICEVSEMDIAMDTSIFTELEDEGDSLFKEYEDHVEWSFEFAQERYKTHMLQMVNVSKMGTILIHLVGYHIVSELLGYVPEKPLRIVITDRQKVASSYMYINLISCTKTLEKFSQWVELDIDFSDYTLDLDYDIFCNNGRVVGRNNKLWSWKEKRNILVREGIEEGSILVLWERTRINDSNPYGRLRNATLVRVDQIKDDNIVLTHIPVVKTREELIDDYYSISEDRRYLFNDLLDFSVHLYTKNYPLVSLGIRNYFSKEEKLFVEKLDEYSKVNKKITVGGKTGEVEMNEINAIYWLLCQFDIEFDHNLFKNMYSPDKNLLWDEYN